jgi:hypothetical protein
MTKEVRMTESEKLRDALRQIVDELGVPGPDYPAPVGNAYDIAQEALRIPIELRPHRFAGYPDQSWQIRLRFILLMPFDCKWNGWVRDFTAWLERKF